MLLVGDSLMMTVYGESSPKTGTMEILLRHSQAVKKSAQNNIPIIGDMPAGSYESPNDALRNACRFRDIGISHLKMEGGREILPQIRLLLAEGFTITGHLGLLPQTAQRFCVQGTQADEAQQIHEDAKILEQEGVFALVLECIPENLAQKITDSLTIPTIGIGAGRYTTGQILVFNDLVGRTDPHFCPKFLQKFGDVHTEETLSVQRFCDAVRTKVFPDKKHCY